MTLVNNETRSVAKLTDSLPGAKVRAGHRASLFGILGAEKMIPIRSVGTAFAMKGHFPYRMVLKLLSDFATARPGVVPSSVQYREWASKLNAEMGKANPEIVIASTSDDISRRTYMALIGGASHEGFHRLYSGQGYVNVSDLEAVVAPYWNPKVPYSQKTILGLLANAQNVFEDVRIERIGNAEFPGVHTKMADLADFILDQEAPVREMDLNPKAKVRPSPSRIALSIFREVGLGYSTFKTREALAHYKKVDPKTYDLIRNGALSPLLAEVIPNVSTPKAIEAAKKQVGHSTSMALKFVSLLFDLSIAPPPPPPPPPAPKPEKQKQESKRSPKQEQSETEETEEQSEGGDDSESDDDSEGDEKPQTKKTAPKDSDSDSDDSEDSDSDSDDDSEDSDDDSEGEGDEGDSDGSDDSEDEGEDEDEDSEDEDEDSEDDSDEDSEGDSEGEGEDDSEGDSDGSESDSEDEGEDSEDEGEDEGEGDSDDSDDEGSKDPSESAPEGAEGGKEASKDDSKTAADILNADSDGLEDYASALEEAVKDAIKEAAAEVQVGEKPYRPMDASEDKILPVTGNPTAGKAALNRIIKNTKKETAFLRSRLRNLFRALESGGRLHGVHKGRILSERFLVDTMASLRAGTDPKRAFVEDTETMDVSIAAYIVVDESSSMHSKLADTTNVLYTLADGLNSIGAKFAISGFRNGYWQNTSHDWEAGRAAKNNGCHRTEPIIHDLFKGFEERFQDVSWKLTNLVATGSTPMADGVELALTALSTRREGHRVIFVVTDGMPDYEHSPVLKNQIRRAREAGIQLIGVGLGSGSEYVKTCFDDSVFAYRLNELPTMLVEKLEELVLKIGTSKRGKKVADTSGATSKTARAVR